MNCAHIIYVSASVFSVLLLNLVAIVVYSAPRKNAAYIDSSGSLFNNLVFGNWDFREDCVQRILWEEHNQLELPWITNFSPSETNVNGWNLLFRIIKGGAVATQQMDVGNRIKQVMVRW